MSEGMSDDAAEVVMERLAQGGRYDIEVSIVNAGQNGAQFFMAELRENRLDAFARRSTFNLRKCYGVGTGDTIQAALLKCEQVTARSPIEGYEAVVFGRDAAPANEVDE